MLLELKPENQQHFLPKHEIHAQRYVILLGFPNKVRLHVAGWSRYRTAGLSVVCGVNFIQYPTAGHFGGAGLG